MIQKKIGILVISTLISILGYSQKAPGYLGNRLSLGGNFQISPALVGPNKNENKGFLKFNTQVGASLEFVTNRNSSILAHYQIYDTKKEYDNFILQNGVGFPIAIDDLFAKLKVTSFAVEFRRYSNSIAPYGLYTGIGLSYKMIDLIQPPILRNQFGTNIPKNDSPYSLISLGITVGKQRIYFNRLIVSTGVSINIPLEFSKINLFRDNEDPLRYNESDEVYNRIVLHDLINFKVGARLLLF
jgi:hypothetical protein